MIRGIRGATTVVKNDKTVLLEETKKLLQEMITVNDVEAEQLSSVLFTMTHDLNAVFPAAALREIAGFQYVPVICFQEIDVPTGLSHCIRILMNWETEKSQRDIKHVYLNKAVALRPDLKG